jgi:hypothetical protein
MAGWCRAGSIYGGLLSREVDLWRAGVVRDAIYGV